MPLFPCPFCRVPVASLLEGCIDDLDAECGICFSDDKPRMLVLRPCGHAVCYACCERMETDTPQSVVWDSASGSDDAS